MHPVSLKAFSAALCLALALASTALASNVDSPAPQELTPSELIQKGDVFYDQLQPAEALKFYLPAEKLDSNNVRLLVRISRQYRHLMSDAANATENEQLGKTAVDYARRAVALAPEDSEAQLAL